MSNIFPAAGQDTIENQGLDPWLTFEIGFWNQLLCLVSEKDQKLENIFFCVC